MIRRRINVCAGEVPYMITETYDPGEDRKKIIKRLQEELSVLHREAKNKNVPVIIVFEGWYDQRIGRIINAQLEPMDPRGYDFYFTEAPTSSEKQMPFMWRFMTKVPPKGKFAVFDRSWYMRGLVEYLDDYPYSRCPEKRNGSKDDARRREADGSREGAQKSKADSDAFRSLVCQINAFEKTLVNDGYVIIKIYFGIRREEQKEAIGRIKSNRGPFDMDIRSREKRYYEDLDLIKNLLNKTDRTDMPWNLVYVAGDAELSALRTMKIIVGMLSRRLSVINDGSCFNASVKKSALPERAPAGKDGTDFCRKPDLTYPADENITADRPDIASDPGRHVFGGIDLRLELTEKQYQKELSDQQEMLLKQHRRMYKKKKSMVIVFEGWDAAGKGGCIKRIVQAMNPRLYRVVPVGAPTPSEKNRHYLWRFLEGVPKCGVTTIYDRSWYGRVLVERVEDFASEDEWQRAYDEINHFEKTLTSSGILVRKFWLHLSKEKQLERFMDRQNDPKKQWKLTDDDWRNRGKWDQYHEAAEEMIVKTSTKNAPWIIVESEDQLYARIKVLKEINRALKDHLD